MNVRSFVEELELTNGQSVRINCPVCGGSKTFTATNNMGSLVWNCYKASCSVSGGTRVHLTADDIRRSLGRTVAETVALDFAVPNWLIKGHPDIQVWCDKYEIDAHQIGLYYDVKEDRVVFPIHHEGKMVDASGRAITKRLPKWRRYGKTTLPYHYGTGSVAVIVEDCVSAAVVGGECDAYTGVALLGTSLSEGHRAFLSRYDTAVVALDPDALKKTLQIAKELRGYVDTVRVLKLQNDLKYRVDQDFDALNKLRE